MMTTTAKTGVLLINLGTPDAPNIPAVRRYLKEFLMDPYVITLPHMMRWLLVHGIILPTRPKATTKLYQKIWTAQGSPLLLWNQALCDKVSDLLGDAYHVVLGMRYGKPSINTAVAELLAQPLARLMIVPLFPQYSLAATESAIQKAKVALHQAQCQLPTEIITDFFAHPLFIDAIAHKINTTLAGNKPDCLLFSYHGLPVQHIERSGCTHYQQCEASTCKKVSDDNRLCYRSQCYATSQAVAETLGLSTTNYRVAFQSRLGRTPWIKPYTDMLLPQLREQGVAKLAVACPSFTADCLETLEEIGIRASMQWQALGGESLQLIPCLNDDPLWVAALGNMIKSRNVINDQS